MNVGALMLPRKLPGVRPDAFRGAFGELPETSERDSVEAEESLHALGITEMSKSPSKDDAIEPGQGRPQCSACADPEMPAWWLPNNTFGTTYYGLSESCVLLGPSTSFARGPSSSGSKDQGGPGGEVHQPHTQAHLRLDRRLRTARPATLLVVLLLPRICYLASPPPTLSKTRISQISPLFPAAPSMSSSVAAEGRAKPLRDSSRKRH